ncbi:hypothetical protein CEXT_113401 [Caerostris extrusa]|uniref:C2H2-type domain-containing protein n=1 Tax=Caerostris extrusa TaxID=172846 RepID=A0AAV4MCM7_CAEEX|nr:hypothetical protein CEXT_113401 [Caerostris extrusa]
MQRIWNGNSSFVYIDFRAAYDSIDQSAVLKKVNQSPEAHLYKYSFYDWATSTAELAKCAKRHQCTSCGYTSIRSADLKKHIRIHTGERPYPKESEVHYPWRISEGGYQNKKNFQYIEGPEYSNQLAMAESVQLIL